MPCSFGAVHFRHFPVDQAHVKTPAGSLRLFYLTHRFLAAIDEFCLHSQFFKQQGGMFAGAAVIVHNQDFHGRQGIVMGTGFLRKTKGQFYCGCSALAFLALNADCAAHQFYKIIGNGHAKARAAESRGRRGGGLFKRQVELFQKFLAHAYAGIADNEAKGNPVLTGRHLHDFKADGSALRSKLQ